MILPPWYDTDYGGEFPGEYLALLRKITFRPKTHPHKRYHTKGKIQKYLIFFSVIFRGEFRGAETPEILKKY